MKTMRIGINIEQLYPGKIGGAEQYVRNILKEMAKFPHSELFVFVNENATSTFKDSKNVKYFVINSKEGLDAQLNFYIDMLNIDIMFCPLFHLAPDHCPVPSVVSILDIQQEYFPQYFSKDVLKARKKRTAQTLNFADAIITISEFSKKTILDKYNISANKVKVTYLNSDACFEKTLKPERLEEIRSVIGAEYIFYPANSWPHKNHITLLKAFLILKKKYHTSLKLVFTGDGKQEKKEILTFITRNHIQDDIIHLGYIPQEDMPYIFANATILVFPSLFEGFGIPLVEAMRVGVPIACSNTTSVPEIVGDAALLFDPTNADDIAKKLNLLEHDAALREELIGRGKKRALKFSWLDCAEQTYNFLKETLAVHNVTKGNNDAYVYNKLPLVSIITPSYNQGKYIRETIESVLKQSYPRIEYIVMDGGSTDNTVEILKEYGDRIVWRSQKDDGQADAVNKGISIAHGEIIGWLNSDDTYLESAVSKAVDFLTGHPQIDAVYGEGYYTDISSNITGRYPTEKFDYNRLAENCFICQPTVFFKKKALQNVGCLDKRLQLCMDYELWIRMAQKGRISYVPEYLATSRMYEENKTLSRRREVFEEICSVVKKYYRYVPNSWIIGYADWLSHGERGVLFRFSLLRLFIKYNLSNFPYSIDVLGKALKRLCEKKEVFTGQYPDGWITSKYHTELTGKGKENILFLKGEHIWPLEDALEIKIYLEKKKIGHIKIVEKGIFQYKIYLDTPLHEKEYSIDLICNKEFCPRALGINNDNRNLAFILNDLYLSEGDL